MRGSGRCLNPKIQIIGNSIHTIIANRTILGPNPRFPPNIFSHEEEVEKAAGEQLRQEMETVEKLKSQGDIAQQAVATLDPRTLSSNHVAGFPG